MSVLGCFLDFCFKHILLKYSSRVGAAHFCTVAAAGAPCWGPCSGRSCPQFVQNRNSSFKYVAHFEQNMASAWSAQTRGIEWERVRLFPSLSLEFLFLEIGLCFRTLDARGFLREDTYCSLIVRFASQVTRGFFVCRLIFSLQWKKTSGTRVVFPETDLCSWKFVRIFSDWFVLSKLVCVFGYWFVFDPFGPPYLSLHVCRMKGVLSHQTDQARIQSPFQNRLHMQLTEWLCQTKEVIGHICKCCAFLRFFGV